jgi:hypothetical protein
MGHSNRLILSSKWLRKHLKNLDLDIRDKDECIKVICQNKRFSFGGDEFGCVESKSDFECETTVGQLRRLCKICGILEEQPIVIGFDTFNSFINLDQTVI